MQVATHHGGFHADDVLSWALLSTFLDPQAELVRTRDEARLAAADIVFDVGGVFDPERGRFDHHQHSYAGSLSSAGMVLGWLESQGHVAPALAARLRAQLVGYIDDVDNGRRAPVAGVPCFATMVRVLNKGRHSHAELDVGFHEAALVARTVLSAIIRAHRQHEADREAVLVGMKRCLERNSNLLVLDSYVSWRELFFAHGGLAHPAEFVLSPGVDEDWRVVCVPVRVDSFENRVSLPEAWAGLIDEELCEAAGVEGAIFCHKNRFIAVFATRDGALSAIRGAGLLR